LDLACLPPLLDISRPVLPARLVERLERWDELDEPERQVTVGDLRLMAAIMTAR
jgi:hypothetical protein